MQRTLLWFLIGAWWCELASAQRFLRQGFSNQEDFGAEMKVEDADRATDMTREMFLMQDLPWQIQSFSGACHIRDPALRRHVQHYLGPIDVRLSKQRGPWGLRAVGRTASGKKLRAFWRPALVGELRSGVDFLQASYDEACRARLFTVEFEMLLPPISKRHTARPSLVYQVSVEPGSLNPKALVPRSAGRVFLLPPGERKNRIALGTAHVSAAPIKPGLVDPSWAKGRPIFRRGRNSGLM
jgi:hypothetical protein